MNRKLFVLLVVLMSLSLIGIIFVQGYWIKSTVQDREEQFSYNAKQVLIEVSEQIQSSEFERYIFEYEAQLRNSEQKIDRITLTEYLIATRDEFKNEDVFNFGTIQEADYKISSDFLGAEKQNDSIQIKKLINRKVTQIVKDKGEDSGAVKSASDVMKRVMRLEDYEKEILRDVISEAAARQPLRKRVSEKTIENLLTRGLARRHLNTKFEYAVYSNSIETGVHSENFDVSHPATYGVPLFVDREGNSSYQLLVNFNGKKGVVLSSVTLMAVLSIVFYINHRYCLFQCFITAN